MKRSYSKGKITVFWDSDKCTHSGVCDNWLPQVFNPQKRPWVNLDGADIETIKRVIDCCPSGALSYKTVDEKKLDKVTIEVVEDGPYKVTGSCKLVNSDGKVLNTGNTFILCRCGASEKMPFCDGSHISKGFLAKKTK